jgi:hypothetical protein
LRKNAIWTVAMPSFDAIRITTAMNPKNSVLSSISPAALRNGAGGGVGM